MNIEKFKNYLISDEKSDATIERYVRDVTTFIFWLNGREMNKDLMIQYKAELVDKYEPASVNTMLASLNAYFDFIGHSEFKVRNLKIQKGTYIEPKRELTKSEYERLLKTAYDMGKHRIYYIMQTICSCGIRVSELRFITVEALKKGVAYISNKGKTRRVYIPDTLPKLIQPYVLLKKIKCGAIFVTRTGKPIDRSNIWAEMKSLCKKAGVLVSKVFPHNLRHLFARTYYKVHQDVVRLADILGHSSVNTTRIYTAESGEIHYKRIQVLGLVLDLMCRNTT
ncbi:MAG: tyrosine-type recombinase/integrase [Clostridia bacterium]|nr:tyrosine-type recombinase/integrase [Clostridia bacterium]